MTNQGKEDDFLSNPKVLEHYSFLQEVGVFKYIDSLQKEIRSYKNLLKSAAEIFNCSTVDDITDAAVWQISDQFLPSFIIFLWRPLQNKQEVIIKGYKNYKMMDLSLDIQTLSPFEHFFQQYPKPINYDLLAFQLGDKETTKSLDEIHPELVAPILGPSELYGLILIGPKILDNEYTSQELAFLAQLMRFVSLAIQNNLHYEHSVRDVKTGLFNHGFFISRLNEEIARAKRGNSFGSIIVIDVDKFKHFNDTYGHLAGDRVLEHIAITIKNSVREDDIPSRFGGEEFTILLPNTNRDIAWIVAERLRESVSKMAVPWEIPIPQVTISAGVTSFDKFTALSSDDIIKHADGALYLSKERGRNRTTIWGSGLLFRIENLKREKKLS